MGNDGEEGFESVDEGGCSYAEDACPREDKDDRDRVSTEAEPRSHAPESNEIGGNAGRRP